MPRRTCIADQIKKASTKQVVSENEMNLKITVKMVVFKSEIEQFDCDFKLQFTFNGFRVLSNSSNTIITLNTIFISSNPSAGINFQRYFNA